MPEMGITVVLWYATMYLPCEYHGYEREVIARYKRNKKESNNECFRKRDTEADEHSETV